MNIKDQELTLLQKQLIEEKQRKSQPKFYLLSNSKKTHVDTKELIKPMKFTDFGKRMKFKRNRKMVTVSPHSFKPKMDKRQADKMVNRNFFGTQENDKGRVSINGVPSNFSFTDKSSLKDFSLIKTELGRSDSFNRNSQDLSQQSKQISKINAQGRPQSNVSPKFVKNIGHNVSITSIQEADEVYQRKKKLI